LIFDSWPLWHIALIVPSGLLIPVVIASFYPIEQIEVTHEDEEKIEQLRFTKVLTRVMIVVCPIAWWLLLGIVVLDDIWLQFLTFS